MSEFFFFNIRTNVSICGVLGGLLEASPSSSQHAREMSRNMALLQHLGSFQGGACQAPAWGSASAPRQRPAELGLKQRLARGARSGQMAKHLLCV